MIITFYILISMRKCIFIVIFLICSQPVLSGNQTKDQSFYLKDPKGKLHGPYLYKHDSKVGKHPSTYKINIDKDGSFTLDSTHTEHRYGPFLFQDGATMEMETTSFIILSSLSSIRGKITHQDLSLKRSPVNLVKLNKKSQDDFIKLQLTLQTLAQQYEDAIQPYMIKTSLVNCRGITRRDANVINISSHDKARAMQTYGMRAQAELKRYITKHSTRSISLPKNRQFSFTRLKPGDYVIYCNGNIKNTESKSPLFLEAIWWQAFSITTNNNESIQFDSENMRNWYTFSPEPEFK